MLDGLYTDIIQANGFWVGAWLLYIAVGGTACVLIFRWGMRDHRIKNIEKRLDKQEDLTKPLAEARKLRDMNGQYKKTGT